MYCFNPHPLRRAGATLLGDWLCSYLVLFQSSPAPKSGCNQAVAGASTTGDAVSILTRSEERVQLNEASQLTYASIVSILTRSEERVQPLRLASLRAVFDVSILTRSEERVQL